jgi:hypothetical protein
MTVIMSKYRKRPVVVDAVLIAEIVKHAHDSQCALQELWVRENIDANVLAIAEDGIFIKTLEGTMKGNLDDMLILGVHGEVYACKPDIFDKTYEKVEE